jgi:hypothetical protein
MGKTHFDKLKITICSWIEEVRLVTFGLGRWRGADRNPRLGKMGNAVII